MLVRYTVQVVVAGMAVIVAMRVRAMCVALRIIVVFMAMMGVIVMGMVMVVTGHGSVRCSVLASHILQNADCEILNRPGAGTGTCCAGRISPTAARVWSVPGWTGSGQGYLAAIGLGVGSAILLSVLRSV